MAITFSRQNDVCSRACTSQYWENLVLVVVFVLESKALHWRLRNDRRHSILRACHYAVQSSASDWLKVYFIQTEVLPRSGWWRVICMEFLRPSLKPHYARKPVKVLRNVGCFLKLTYHRIDYIFSALPTNVQQERNKFVLTQGKTFPIYRPKCVITGKVRKKWLPL